MSNMTFAEFTNSYGQRRISVVPERVCSVQDISHEGTIRTAIICMHGPEHVVKESYEQVLAVLSAMSEWGNTVYWDADEELPRRKSDGYFFVDGIWSEKPETPWS